MSSAPVPLQCRETWRNQLEPLRADEFAPRHVDRASFRYPKRRENALEAVALRLVALGQLGVATKRFLRLVDSETRWFRGDLEEDAAWLAEVDRRKVLPVDHRCYLKTGFPQAFAPGALLLPVAGSEGDIMDSSRALPPDRSAVVSHEVDDAAWRLQTQTLEARTALLADLLIAHHRP